jgi:hypothetical protein
MPNFFDTTRFTVNDGVDDTAVYPIVSGLKYIWQPEGETRFFRKKLQTKLLFKGADYTFFKALYDAGTCADITILIETLCGGVWSTEYQGRIIVSDGDYHLDRCEVTYSILPNDVYECLFRYLKTPVDFHNFGSRSTVKSIYGTVETITCTYNGPEFGSSALKMFYKDCWSGGTNEFNTGFTPDALLAWRPIENNQDFDTPVAGELQLVTTWARETITYPGGPPPGEGWINTTGDVWVRPVMYGVIEQDEFSTSTIDGHPQYNFVANVADVDIDNGRPMNDAFTQGIDCDLDEVQSDFFGINPPGDAPSNDAYDWAAAYAQAVIMFQKSDIVRASASANASRNIMTFGDLLKAFQEAFNVYWGVSGNVMRIEHWSFFDGANGIDLTTLDGGKYIVGTNAFSAEGTIPALEKFSTQEAFSDDFLEKQIEYPQECSDADNVIEHSQSLLCLDVGGLLDNSDAGLKGFVLVSTADLGGDEYLIDNTNDTANGAMAWRVMFQALWAYGRYGPDANSTAGAFTVSSVRKRKEQKAITFKYCCDQGEFDATQLIQTGLGWGQIKLAEQDKERKTMKVTLLQN